MRLLIAIAVTLYSTAALGQMWNPPSPPLNPWQGANDVARIQQMQRQTEQMQQQNQQQAYELQRARANYQLRQQVGGLVASGQCEAAKTTALNAGDFDLAQQAVSICQPKQ